MTFLGKVPICTLLVGKWHNCEFKLGTIFVEIQSGQTVDSNAYFSLPSDNI